MSGETNGFDADGNPVQYKIGGRIDKSFLKPEISNMIKQGEKKEDKGDKMSGELRERIAKVICSVCNKCALKDYGRTDCKDLQTDLDDIIVLFLEQVERCRPTEKLELLTNDLDNLEVKSYNQALANFHTAIKESVK